MHNYKFYWLNGFATEVSGVNPRDAFKKTIGHRIADILKIEEIK